MNRLLGDAAFLIVISSLSHFSGLGHTPLTATAAMPAAHMKIYRGEPVDNSIAENVKIGKSRKCFNLSLAIIQLSSSLPPSRGSLDPRGEHRQPEHLRHAHLRVHGQGRPRVVRAETDQRRGVSLASFKFGWLFCSPFLLICAIPTNLIFLSPSQRTSSFLFPSQMSRGVRDHGRVRILLVQNDCIGPLSGNQY